MEAALFASAALLTLCRLLLLGGARLAAGRGLVSALALLGRWLLAHALILLRGLARVALSSGRGLTSLVSILASILVLLCRGLL